MERTDKNIVKKAIAPRPDDAHKGTMGALLSVCGSFGMAGAGILSGAAALRCGLGLLKCALPKSIYPIAASKLLESVFLPLEENADGKISAGALPYLLEQKADAALLGCGLSVCDDTRELITGFIRRFDKPMVLDADALNCIADDPSVLKDAKAPIIITPHPMEMARLCGTTAAEVNLDRENTARSFAARYAWLPEEAATCSPACAPLCWLRARLRSTAPAPLCICTAWRAIWRPKGSARYPCSRAISSTNYRTPSAPADSKSF